jgi:hypothetical protein
MLRGSSQQADAAHLDLRHGWPTSPDSTTSKVDTIRSRTEEGKEGGCCEAGEAEEQEGC